MSVARQVSVVNQTSVAPTEVRGGHERCLFVVYSALVLLNDTLDASTTGTLNRFARMFQLENFKPKTPNQLALPSQLFKEEPLRRA